MHTGSKGWLQLRMLVLTEERFTCRACGRFGDHVDHVNGKAGEFADYERANLQCLCLECHSRKTRKESNAKAQRWTGKPW